MLLTIFSYQWEVYNSSVREREIEKVWEGGRERKRLTVRPEKRTEWEI